VLLLAGLHVCVCRDDETKLEFGAIAKFTPTPGGLHDAVAVLEDERRRPFGGQAVKLVVFIRHGEAEHNVAEAHAGHDMWYYVVHFTEPPPGLAHMGPDIHGVISHARSRGLPQSGLI
jgi:hypothetical protein